LTRARRLVFFGLALATFGLAAGSVFGRVVQGGFERVILTETGAGPSSLALLFGDQPGAENATGRWRRMLEADHRFTVWATGRNARALLHAPLHVFDAESCHPAARVLAFGHPLLTFGVLGIPAELATGDPVAAYNLVTILLPLVAALALYLLVVEWTGVPVAGIAAGLLYGFHASKLENVFHPFAEDTGWTVLGMLFLTRFFERGRTRDGLGAASAWVLQLGSSLYSVVTSICVSAPFALWLLWRYRGGAIRPAAALASIAAFAVPAAFVLWPYAVFLTPGEAEPRSRLYGSWDAVVPSGVGLVAIGVLALLGLLSGRRGARSARGVEWLLAGVALFCALVSTGGNVNARRLAEAAGREVPVALPNVYEALAAVLPGIETVRVAGFTDAGTHLALCALAGLGAASLVRVVPGRWRSVVGALLVLTAWLGALGAPRLGIPSPVTFDTFAIRPPESTLAFHRELERLGNTGPILELPAPVGLSRIDQQARRQLVSAYHHRRTSACYNSYLPPEVDEVEVLSGELPSPAALQQLRGLGFTTIVVHHPLGRWDPAWSQRAALEPLTRGQGAPLRELHGVPSMTAYAIDPGAEPSPRGRP